MGIFADWALGAPSIETVDHAAIAHEMRETVGAWFNAHIVVMEPAGDHTPYDPINDTGGFVAGETVYDSGVNGALVQPIRGSAPMEYGEFSTMIQSIRFQCVRHEGLERLRSGLTVLVVDGGESDELDGMTFSLKNGYNGSISWHRILEATVVGGTIPS